MSNPTANTPDFGAQAKAALAEAEAHFRAGRLHEAERTCRTFLDKVGANGHVYNTLGVVLRAQRRAVDALTIYREALRLMPDNASAWSNLSNALNELERYDEAIEAGKEAVRLQPGNATFRDNLANVEGKLRKPRHTSRPRHRIRNQKPKMLFVSHEASRTGAPVLLLTFLNWLKKHADVEIEILVKSHSDWRLDKKEQLELIPDFEALGHTSVWYRKSGKRTDLAHISDVRNRISGANFDLVFSNTICNGEVLAEIGPLVNCPIISYVHELEYSIRCNPPRHVANVMKYTTDYVAGSHVVRNNLIQSHDIASERIGVVPSFIEIVEHRPETEPDEIRRQLGIAADAFIVNACATVEWRKGPELFALLASEVRRRGLATPAHFVWVGNPLTLSFFELRYDISRMGLEDCVHFIGARSNFRDYLAAADVFALMSREDPFPLVVLEAALMRRPILCFDRAGGAGEFVEQDCGFVIPYLDIRTMADKVVELAGSKSQRESMGLRASEKVRERHDAAVGSSQLWDIIRTVLAPAQAASA